MLAFDTQGNCTSEASTSTFSRDQFGEHHEQVRQHMVWR